MRIAAAQVHPAWLDPARGTTIVTDWVGRAADEGVELVAFGETFLGGYPLWIGVHRRRPVRQRGPEARLRRLPRRRRRARRAGDRHDHRGGRAIVACSRTSASPSAGAGPGRGTVYCTLVAIDPGAGRRQRPPQAHADLRGAPRLGHRRRARPPRPRWPGRRPRRRAQLLGELDAARPRRDVRRRRGPPRRGLAGRCRPDEGHHTVHRPRRAGLRPVGRGPAQRRRTSPTSSRSPTPSRAEMQRRRLRGRRLVHRGTRRRVGRRARSPTTSAWSAPTSTSPAFARNARTSTRRGTTRVRTCCSSTVNRRRLAAVEFED